MAKLNGAPSKLVKLREWLELPAAAKYLSAAWGEDISEADVLRLGLDGKLTLSIHLVNLGSGRPVNVVPLESVEWEDVPHPIEPGTMVRLFKGDRINDTEAVTIPDALQAEKLEGVYDLPMIGAERLEVEHEYQLIVGGSPVELTILAGCFVRRDGKTYQLLERWPNNEYHRKRNQGKPYMHLDWFLPAQNFPDGTAIVVRTAALREIEGDFVDFEEKLRDAQKQRALAVASLEVARFNAERIQTKLNSVKLDLEFSLDAERALRDNFKHLKSEVEFLKAELTKVSGSRWPWGNYSTAYLDRLAEATKEFWCDYDPRDAKPPTNDEVASWLTGRGVTENIAKAMATILRPNDLATGRRKV